MAALREAARLVADVATSAIEDGDVEAKLRVQIRFWAKVASTVVLASNVTLALWPGEPFRWTIVGLDCVWAIALVLGASRPRWLAVSVIAAVIELSFYGWAAAGAFIVLVAALAMRLPAARAGASTLGMWGAAALGILWLGDGHPPEYVMQPRELMFAACNMFVLGALMRSSLLSRFRAESLASQLHAAHDMLRRDLATTEALAAAQERTRIAHELHDSLGHSLATAHVHTQLARRLAQQSCEPADPAHPALLQAIDQVGESTRRAMHELRDAVSLLRHRSDVATLGTRIRALLARLPEAVLAHEVAIVGDERALAPATEFAIYRALQEAMTNVVKHARARAVSVRLEYTASWVRLEVVDDGAGTDELRPGFGLRGIAERLKSVGGRLDVSSAAGKGLRLRVEVDAA
ncbi:MAG: sensor histidine kinase [Nannocystaceae bacterium]|nr:sensor histidine kinase [Nannocystaceae bacterium]